MYSRKKPIGSSKKIQKKKEELKNFLRENGMKEDRWGNLKDETGETRFKFSSTSLRLEKKWRKNEWVRLKSGYYSKIEIKDGKLHGLTV